MMKKELQKFFVAFKIDEYEDVFAINAFSKAEAKRELIKKYPKAKVQDVFGVFDFC